MLYQISIDISGALSEIPGFQPTTDLGFFVSQIVALMLIAASMITFVYLALGGIQWITAGSDKGKVEEARGRLTNAIIGLAVVAASWAIFLLLNYFFGLGLVSGDGGDDGGDGGDVPAGYCLCGNGECAAVGQRGSYTYPSGPCHVCQSDGSSPLVNPPTTCGVINCSPCP